MRKTLSIALIIIGSLFLLTPFAMDQIVKYQNNKVMAENVLDAPINNADDIEAEYDYSVVKDVDLLSLIDGSKNFDKDLIIGSIEIPDLNMHLPIMKGLTNSNLVVGAATMKPNQSFGAGNYTLAGHYMKNKDLLFGGLMDIELGAIAYVFDGEVTYEYEIYDTLIVPDTAIDVLSDERADEHGKPVLSLMTCHYTSKSGERFFALGELIDEYPGVKE